MTVRLTEQKHLSLLQPWQIQFKLAYSQFLENSILIMMDTTRSVDVNFFGIKYYHKLSFGKIRLVSSTVFFKIILILNIEYIIEKQNQGQLIPT